MEQVSINDILYHFESVEDKYKRASLNCRIKITQKIVEYLLSGNASDFSAIGSTIFKKIWNIDPVESYAIGYILYNSSREGRNLFRKIIFSVENKDFPGKKLALIIDGLTAELVRTGRAKDSNFAMIKKSNGNELEIKREIGDTDFEVVN